MIIHSCCFVTPTSVASVSLYEKIIHNFQYEIIKCAQKADTNGLERLIIYSIAKCQEPTLNNSSFPQADSRNCHSNNWQFDFIWSLFWTYHSEHTTPTVYLHFVVIWATISPKCISMICTIRYHVHALQLPLRQLWAPWAISQQSKDMGCCVRDNLWRCWEYSCQMHNIWKWEI